MIVLFTQLLCNRCIITYILKNNNNNNNDIKM